MIKVVSLSNGTIKIDTTKLDAIQKQAKKQYMAKVGVLGGAPAREEGAVTNADLGAIHEFGTKNIPARSWLRMPLEFQMPKVYQSIGQKLVNSMTTNNVLEIFKQIGIRAESIVQRAFDTRGFGNWAPNAASTIRQKKSDAPLIDTAEFRKSVTSTAEAK